MTTDEPGPEPRVDDEPIFLVDQTSETTGPAPGFRWKLGLVLLVFCLLGTAAIMPYSITLMRQANSKVFTPEMTPVILLLSLVVEGAMSAVAIAIGLALGHRSGLGPFLLAGIDDRPTSNESTPFELVEPARHRAWKTIGLASMMGLVLGALVVGYGYAADSSTPDSETEIRDPSPFEGFLGSIGAGIREEVWLRLGLMTLLAWLGAVILRRETANSPLIWTSNVLAALAFGAMHLPQAAMLYGLNAALVGFVFIGNGIPGITFGWLFWRKGLIAAMIAHFMMDVVMKVILPAVRG